MVLSNHNARPFAPDSAHDPELSKNVERLAKALLPLPGERFFFEILDNMPFGINVIAPDMRVLYVNKYQQSFFPQRKLVGQICYKAYMDNPDREETCPWCASTMAIKSGKVVHRVAPSRREDGTVFNHFEVIAVPLKNDAGEVIAVVELVHDISDRTFNVPLRLEPSKPPQLSQMFVFEKLICVSEKMKNLRRHMELIFDIDAPVLILGETGTGKTLIARIIHDNSLRRKMPFVTINCANMSPTMLESDLFGHKKGAFTGATNDKRGMVETADGGTLFLDELGEMPLEIQAKLLRFLETGEFERVGDTRTQKVNVRLIASTNQNLEEQVDRGRFRADLFYRLNVIALTIPPLRERPEEIPLMAEYFLEETCRKHGFEPKKIHPQVRRIFLDYDWPGNCRQLRHEIEQMAILGRYDEVLTDRTLSSKILSCVGRTNYPLHVEENQYDLKDVVETIEKRMILRVLNECGGNKSKAAERLGLTRRGLFKKIQRYGLDGRPVNLANLGGGDDED